MRPILWAEGSDHGGGLAILNCWRSVMSLVSWLRTIIPTDGEIRTEIWRLGTQHRGDPLKGALEELKAPGLRAGRVVLLRACVSKLQGP